ncbi:MAG: N-acetylgalactosamine-N,N'-diacetylbacillosaminyl-diphospho-undecaprenol 4-alpha-N-acetylgalactosaminyltransferase [Sodalis sp. Psp]|nr:N-acetylgalactosamine-N,N'-diacetylbacillosaminyl-diphospho-undecaprenol 4-alpha-N-acetylgalactosaminyltransferase [Sodalis sp. Psp]MCR3757134.1 N-acetylgalactosamine-N,N'-diacetylbacillosaminyl-diphospho-undecaprenol 4-alpha-N-acetylgalactosaminyltransferase [Sodalis sp. Ppy]
MRVLMIIDGLPGGGAEKMLLTLAQGMMFQGHRVSIFSLRSICDYALPEGIEYESIADYTHVPWRKLTELSRRARTLDKAVWASQQRYGEFDLVVSHLHKTDRIVARSRVLPQDRIWFCLHTIFGYLSHRKNFSRWLKRQKIHNLYQNRNIVAVSRDVLEDMRHAFKVTPRQEKVIYNPFDFVVIRQLAEAPCELTNQDYLIHVGRLHENKRQDRLLKAYAASGIQTPLVILGKGNAAVLQQLKSLAQDLKITDRVLFKAFNSNPYPYIRNARMLILSSDREGFGNVLVEALICQTPVVSTRCPGGPVEILTGDLSVGLADLSSASLAKTMRVVYDNPPAIPSFHLEAYNIKTICQQYTALSQNTP